MDADPAEQLFGTADYDLYVTLTLTSKATEGEIKKAYRKLALIHHPDKCKSADTTLFQQIGYAYAVLSDADRRKRYDNTGRTDEVGLLDGEKRTKEEWDDYFKELWSGEVSAKSIDEFFDTYEDSAEETADLYAAYNTSSGSITHILENVMSRDALTVEDRFTNLINTAIKAGTLKSTSKWKQSLKDTKGKDRRRQAATLEAGEAENLAKELGVHEKLFGKGKEDKGGDEDALRALIQQRGAQRMANTLANLEAKYANQESKKHRRGSKRLSDTSEEAEDTTDRKKKKARTSALPTDEEFAAIQAKLESGKKSGRKSR